MGKHSTPDPAAPPSNLLRDVLAHRRLVAAGLGAVLTVLLGLVLWAVDRPDGGLADGTGGGAASVTGGQSPLDAGSPLASAGTPVAAVESGSPTPGLSATPSPQGPSRSPSASVAPSAAGLSAAFRQMQSWDGGYEAEYTVTNRGTAAVTGWTVVVTFSGTVNFTYWDADAVTGTNNRITFTAKSYNATVPAGGSVSFGLVVRGSPPAAPTACTVNGRAC